MREVQSRRNPGVIAKYSFMESFPGKKDMLGLAMALYSLESGIDFTAIRRDR
jgi:hypothetical protein